LRTQANFAVLFAGIAISVLLGLLAYENGRANRRAAAAVRAEKDLFELNRVLESQIAERTRSLEERSADLVTIADSVAHDLRNPLNSISTNAQLLEQQFSSGLGQDGMSILRQVSHCVEGMAEIIDRLLRLSIVSNVTFSRECLDMRELFAETFEELIATEPPPQVEFVLQDLPSAEADPNLVPILLLNLIGNALKYTRNTEQRRIECGSVLHDGCVSYFVRDNGIGFEPDTEARLFKAFERLADNDEPGLGLGLDIAARIVNRHEGRIWAEGIPGNGACFYFTLGAASPA
jgi:light-regulated signal transduction histidine kinase (bacteriophytochrome)